MKDTVVSGSLRATDTIYSTTAQFSILRAPTTSGGTTFGPGSANNLLKSNGTSIYWTTLAASDIPSISITDKTSGTLTAARGGTGKTNLKDAANALINALDTGSSNLTANDYVITQYVGGGTTTTTYHRRPASALRVGGLLNERNFTVLLDGSSPSNPSTFDGTSDVEIHASGTLGITQGGTGANSAIDAANGLLTSLTITTNQELSLDETELFLVRKSNNYLQFPISKIHALIKDKLVPLTLTAAATGFTITGGTTSKTLTVSENTTLKGGSSTYLAYYSANNTISGHSYAHFSDTYSSSTKNGKNELVLGNATASTSNGSAYGQLALYSSGTKGTYLATAANSTAWYTATLPAASGTIAYTTSDITGTAANVTGTVAIGHGGTGFTEYTKGDLLYASNTNALSKLSIGTKGYYLNSTADGPVWRRPQLYFGTCDSAATATTKEVTCDEYDTLTIGDLIVVKFSITNTGAVGSLKLKVNETDAIAIKKQYHSNSTAQNLSHASELNNSTIALFCYNGTYWIYLNGDYNSTYTINNSLVTSGSGSNITAETSDNGGVGLHGYVLMMMTTNQTWSAISHVSGSTAADQGANSAKVAATANFLLNSPILYIDTKAYVAPGNSSNLTSYTAIAFNLRYSIGITGNTAPTLASQKPVYLVGTVNSDNSTFKLDSAQWWTQTLPTSNDGKIYILLGLAYSASNIYLNTFHPIFYHNGTCIMPYTPGTIPVEQGGTGATSASGARTNLGLGTMATENAANYLKLSGGTMTGDVTAPTFIGDLTGTASSVAWTGITGKPIELKAYFGALNSNGWKTLGGRSSGAKIYVAYNKNPANWNSATYSSSIVFGVADTKGLLDIGHNSPIVTFGGASTGNSDDNNPKWYFKLSGTSDQTYTFPSSSKTLAATDGTGASGSWNINLALQYNSLTKGTNPTSRVYQGCWFGYDKNGIATVNRVGGGLESFIEPDGSTRTELRSYRYASGVNTYGLIGIITAQDGVTSYAFNGTGQATFSGEIVVSAQSTTTEGGQIRLAAAPSYESGQYSAILDVETSSFRIVSNNAARLWLNLTNGDLRVTGRLLPDNAVEVARGGTGATTASAARHNLGIYETIKTGLAVSANGVTSFAVTDASVKTSSIILITTDTEKTYASVVIETGKYTIKVTNNNTTSKTIKAYVLIIY